MNGSSVHYHSELLLKRDNMTKWIKSTTIAIAAPSKLLN